MALNTPYDAEHVAATAIKLLGPDLNIANTFNRYFESEFGGGVGFHVNVRKPITLAGRKRTLDDQTAIVVDNISQTVVPVAQTDHAYSAVNVSDEDLTLKLMDFSKQVLMPQVSAVSRTIEKTCVDVLEATTASSTIHFGADYSGALTAFTAARKELRKMGVPSQGLVAALGTDVYEALLNSGALRNLYASGLQGVLVEGEVKTLSGFTVIESNELNPNDGFFYHGDAFTLAVVAPQVPTGVPFGTSMSDSGFALRYIRDYDSSTLADRSVVSTFVGAKAMEIDSIHLDGTRTSLVPCVKVSTV